MSRYDAAWREQAGERQPVSTIQSAVGSLSGRGAECSMRCFDYIGDVIVVVLPSGTARDHRNHSPASPRLVKVNGTGTRFTPPRSASVTESPATPATGQEIDISNLKEMHFTKTSSCHVIVGQNAPILHEKALL